VAGDGIPEGTEILATGKDVVVIGGGDTGSDCVGTSIRQKARSVTQVEIMPKPPEGRTVQTPWPVHPGPRMLSTSSSQAEGCERDWAVMSKEFLKDESGRLRGIRAVRADWSSGRPQEVPGSEYEIPTQLVLLAMGFLHPEHAVLDDLGVDKDERGNCASNGYATSREGVFAAGDMRRGQSLVVWAISEGRECAREVDEYLTGRPSLLGAKDKSRSDVALVR
jgi:glutamate synthase (NADPH/NADH) small chain